MISIKERWSAWSSMISQLMFGRRDPFKSEVKFDASRRPAGWAGYWSTPYGRVLTRTLAEDPPFRTPAHEVLDAAPRPFRETLDPVASTAEPTDRDGHRLPWRWARSLTADLLGPIGLTLGCVCAVIVIGAAIVSGLALPPLFSSEEKNPLPGAKSNNSERPVQGRSPDSSTPQSPVQQTVPVPAEHAPPVSQFPPAGRNAPQVPARAAPASPTLEKVGKPRG